MNQKSVITFTIILIINVLFISAAGFAGTETYEIKPDSHVYEFLLLTDKYDQPSTEIESRLDLLLNQLDNPEDQSQIIYKYIKYRDQLEISNYYNPLEETLFRIGQDGYTLESLDDLSKLDDLYRDFNKLSSALLPLHYKIELNNSKISISDDYSRLITKYSDYMLYEPLDYLEIMKEYESHFCTLNAKSNVDLNDFANLQQMMQLIVKSENYLMKPNKDFAFEHVKQAYKDMAHQLYMYALQDDNDQLSTHIQSIMPNSQIALTYQDYLTLLGDHNKTLSDDITAYVDELIGKQVRKLIQMDQ